MPRRRPGTSRSARSTSGRCSCCSTAGAACSASAWCPGASAWRRRRACNSRPTRCRASSRRSAGTPAKGTPIERARIVDHVVWQEREDELAHHAARGLGGRGDTRATSCRSRSPGRIATRSACASSPRRRLPRCASSRTSGSWAMPSPTRYFAATWWRRWRRGANSPRRRAGSRSAPPRPSSASPGADFAHVAGRRGRRAPARTPS